MIICIYYDMHTVSHTYISYTYGVYCKVLLVYIYYTHI